MSQLDELLKQAQEMQNKMTQLQVKLDHVEATGQAGGGVVSILISGKGVAKKVTIQKSMMNPNETEILEDLIVAAFNDARGKLESMISNETQKLMGDLKLPDNFTMPE